MSRSQSSRTLCYDLSRKAHWCCNKTCANQKQGAANTELSLERQGCQHLTELSLQHPMRNYVTQISVGAKSCLPAQRKQMVLDTWTPEAEHLHLSLTFSRHVARNPNKQTPQCVVSLSKQCFPCLPRFHRRTSAQEHGDNITYPTTVVQSMCGSMGQVNSVQLPLPHERSRHDFAAAENAQKQKKTLKLRRIRTSNGEKNQTRRTNKKKTLRNDKRQRFVLLDTTHHGFQILPQGHSGKLVEQDTSTCSHSKKHFNDTEENHARQLGISCQLVGEERKEVGTQHNCVETPTFMNFLENIIPVDEGSNHT